MDPAQTDPGARSIISQLVVMFILILINAFFAASEMALVSVDDHRMKERAEEGDPKAKRILKLMEDPSRFLSTIQICITLAGFFNSAAAATGLAQYLGVWFAQLGLPSPYQVATVLLTVVLSFLTIVFGELIPKRLALQNPDGFSLSAVTFLWWASKILRPFVSLLSNITNGILRLMGIEISSSEEQVTMSDIKSIINVGQSQGIINHIEEEMINSIITFDNKMAEEIMTPRTEVFCIDINDPISEFLDELLSVRYSRIPVYDDEIDNIIGVLYIKDFLQAAYKSGFDGIKLRDIIRPAYFVPERKNINELFGEMREDNFHFAVLIDEYGGFSGIVTMEDLLEEIVGDIDDEYDADEPEIEKVSDNIWYAKGTLSIKELNTNLGSRLDEAHEDYDTLGGLLYFLMGRIPEDSEQPYVYYQGIHFMVEEIENKRFARVRIEYDPEEQDEDSETEDKERF